MVRHASDVGHASLGGVSVLATPSGRAQAASFAPVMRDCSTPRMRPSVRDSHALPRVLLLLLLEGTQSLRPQKA